MASHFPEAFAALKQVAEGLILANEGIKRAVDAVLGAQDDHEDLREHVTRLEGMILTLTTDVRELRDGRSNGDPR